MLIKNIEKYMNTYGKIDAILIVNQNDIIEYSAMVTEDRECLKTDGFIGENLFDIYPNLNRENSTHSRVLRTGVPILNESQGLIENTGKKFNLVTSTFPIESEGKIVGTIDITSKLDIAEEKKWIKTKKPLYTLDSIITQDENMMLLKSKIAKVAKSDSPVMVVGESGTGKELVVEAIHTMSNRKKGPFISLNCAAVPDSLIESTLFGTIKGSFTGAENKKGLFEMADKGTLFLDEINSMNLEMQAKLLKVVEEQRYMKVGGESYTNVDVRIVSAINVSPTKAVEENILRRDLFYRLSVVQLQIPPLRQRKKDINLLTEHFIEEYNLQMKKEVKGLSDLARKGFSEYDWPGNVRELKNVMESAFNMVEGDLITVADLPEYMILGNHKPVKNTEIQIDGSLQELMNCYEKEIITEALKKCTSLNQTASLLKVTRQALKYKIDKYDIDYKVELQNF